MSDEFLVSYQVPPSTDGFVDGLDPALPNEMYPITTAQQLQNVRTAGGKWETRLGLSYPSGWTQPVASSGAIRLFDTLYPSAGTIIRLMARGDDNAARFFKLLEGTDTSFQLVSGGTGLGTTTSTQPYFSGTAIKDRYVFTDRAGALRQYKTAGTVSSIAQPVRPTTAPRAKPWTYAMLEEWSGAAPFGWTQSDAANFSIAVTTNFVAPMGTRTVEFTVDSSGSRGDTISEDVTGEALNSHTIAFWWHQDGTRSKYIQFGFGNQAADEFVQPLQVTKRQEWYPIFIPIGNIPTINKKRWKVIRENTTQTFQCSQLFLPGRLEGTYRWIYTHYDPTSGDDRESEPSDISNSNQALDLSAIGISLNDTNAANAFQKSAMLDFTSDSGTDATTTKIRIYRSGGVPELTIGPDGRDVWYRVGEVFDINTTLSNSPIAGATSFNLTSTTNLAAGDWLVLNKGNSTEEYVKVASGYAGGNPVTITSGLLNGHSAGETAQIAFLDNTPNEAINVFQPIDQERDDPPSASHWVARAPDGRIWVSRYSGHPTGTRVSNKPTPDRPNDWQIYPDGVDPVTRQNPLQGWGFDIGGDASGEEITWAGFFRGLYHIFTRNRLYRVNALSQPDWGPNAVQKVLDVGCIAGETVQIHEGVLYWVSEGPRVVRWPGEGREEVISHQRVNVTLSNALQQNWNRWFARVHENTFGRYYSLFYDYQDGNSGVINAVQYNITQNAWEQFYSNDSNGDRTAYHNARVFDGGADQNYFALITVRGYAYYDNVAGNSTDTGVAIPVSWKTKRVPLNGVSEIREIYFRAAAVSDSLTVQVSCGGSDYGGVSRSYTFSLAGSGDVDVRVPVERELKGRWVELTVSGSVSNRPAIRDCVIYARPLRDRKLTQDT